MHYKYRLNGKIKSNKYAETPPVRPADLHVYYCTSYMTHLPTSNVHVKLNWAQTERMDRLHELSFFMQEIQNSPNFKF